MSGGLRGIYLASKKGEPLRAVDRVRAVPGRGLEGDRYFLGIGSFSRWPGSGRAVSLIEQEAIDAVRHEHGLDVSQGRSRRNLVTQGVHLAELIGRRCRIGTALFRGCRPCAPCRYLQRLAGPGTFEALAGRGGLRAEILEEGIIAVGDSIELLTP
jgi:MOSC domain-containing protein YiiM